MKTEKLDGELEEAKERVERAKKYAKMFPEFIRPGDEKFQTVEWQLKQLQGFREKCAPPKP